MLLPPCRPGKRPLADDLKTRLSLLRRSLDAANVMLSQRLPCHN